MIIIDRPLNILEQVDLAIDTAENSTEYRIDQILLSKEEFAEFKEIANNKKVDARSYYKAYSNEAIRYRDFFIKQHDLTEEEFL